MKPSTKQWWRRAAASAKDQQSLCLSRWGNRPEMKAAVIKATSHDDASLDYKNARRVFSWARASPSSLLHPLLRSLSRRASRTRSWPVALKSLLLAHGLLLFSSSSSSPPAARLPFDLSDFRDRSPHAWGFSAFVRAYFNFLDHRSLFLTHHRRDKDGEDEDDEERLHRIEKLQSLLDLLIQIRPYADGMKVALVLEAMDCAIIEIFEVYIGICNGIAAFLVGYMGNHGSSSSNDDDDGGEAEGRRRIGVLGVRVLRRAVQQSKQLSAYFDLCRRLGVQNAEELPPVERIPEEDIVDLEKLVMGYVPGGVAQEVVEEKIVKADEGGGGGEDEIRAERRPGTVVTDEWVVFEEERGGPGTHLSAPTPTMDDLQQLPKTWASSMVHRRNGGLFEFSTAT